jgi:hypothetical protein
VHAGVADLLTMEASQERRSRRAADGVVIELPEAEALGRELVEMRGGDLAAVAAKIGPAEIVGQNDDDIGLLDFRSAEREKGASE